MRYPRFADAHSETPSAERQLTRLETTVQPQTLTCHITKPGEARDTVLL